MNPSSAELAADMFIHRMLLEWFAKRYVEPGTKPGEDIE
jgi:hypothetical protein